MAIRDITLGQYYPCESVIHSLDPRIKIAGTVAFLVSLFLIKSFPVFILAALYLAAVIILSKVPFRFMAKGLKTIIVLIIFTMLINMLWTPGNAIFTVWKISITEEGIQKAVFMAVRLVLLIFGSSLLTLTTKPISLTDGIERIMLPLTLIGVPSHEIAMMMSIALRFIPTLLEETDKIMKAQTARGADFENGNLIEKAKALIPLLVPLFVSAFRIAADLAMAMESRCYHGGKGRTRMNAMKYTGKDAMAAIIVLLYLALIIASRYVVVL